MRRRRHAVVEVWAPGPASTLDVAIERRHANGDEAIEHESYTLCPNRRRCLGGPDTWSVIVGGVGHGDRVPVPPRRRRLARRPCVALAAAGRPRAVGRRRRMPSSHGTTTAGPASTSPTRCCTSCTSAPSPPTAPSTPRSDQLPRLADLGVTLIEVMPVAAFPGTRNWGYDGVFPFAVQHSYGGPTGSRQVRRRRARSRAGRRPRCRVQPHRTGGQRARALRPLLHRRLSHTVG